MCPLTSRFSPPACSRVLLRISSPPLRSLPDCPGLSSLSLLSFALDWPPSSPSLGLALLLHLSPRHLSPTCQSVANMWKTWRDISMAPLDNAGTLPCDWARIMDNLDRNVGNAQVDPQGIRAHAHAHCGRPSGFSNVQLLPSLLFSVARGLAACGAPQSFARHSTNDPAPTTCRTCLWRGSQAAP